MDNLVSEKFCKCCETKIKNKEAHLKTRKHQNNIKELEGMISFSVSFANKSANKNNTDELITLCREATAKNTKTSNAN